jgi:4-hydroxy-tetrahydrodipicolinate synthase
VMPFMRLGGAGGICVASHIAGRRIREMIALARSGDLDGAQRIDDELRPLYDALSVTTNPIPLKAALNLLGHEVGGLRLPLVDADDAEVASVQAALAVTGLQPTATA